MTILTKSSGEKGNKPDRLEVPLVEASAPPPSVATDVEVGIQQRRARRISNLTTCCLLLTALCVVGLGIIGGSMLYEQYLRVQMRSRYAAHIPFPEFYMDDDDDDGSNSVRGWGRIPINGDKDELLDDILRNPSAYFQEEFEFTDDSESIDVPEFKDGRSGRFIHDFNTNLTGIIDVSGNRCFVMPLNRQAVLPPKSLFDMVQKMWAGHYDVDTRMVRKSMRVVTPAIEDRQAVGGYISRECAGKPIYRLEKFVGGISKRSVGDGGAATYTQFAGRGIQQLVITNMSELDEYERSGR